MKKIGCQTYLPPLTSNVFLFSRFTHLACWKPREITYHWIRCIPDFSYLLNAQRSHYLSLSVTLFKGKTNLILYFSYGAIFFICIGSYKLAQGES